MICRYRRVPSCLARCCSFDYSKSTCGSSTPFRPASSFNRIREARRPRRRHLVRRRSRYSPSLCSPSSSRSFDTGGRDDDIPGVSVCGRRPLMDGSGASHGMESVAARSSIDGHYCLQLPSDVGTCGFQEECRMAIGYREIPFCSAFRLTGYGERNVVYSPAPRPVALLLVAFIPVSSLVSFYLVS